MAIETSPTAPACQSIEDSGGMDELHALLAAYGDVLDMIDNAPPVLWAKPDRPRVVHRLAIPTSRLMVRTLLVRYVSRRVDFLRRAAARRVALAGDAPGPLRNLTMLERFTQSLPMALRPRLVAPLALLALLFVAYILANFVIQAKQSALLGDLTTAAVNLDRHAAVEAFTHNRLDPWLYFGAAIILAWSVALVIVPLLPAFSVKRQLLRRSPDLQRLEARGFALLNCRRAYDLDLDLVAHLAVIASLLMTGVGLAIGAFTKPIEDVLPGTWAVIAITLALPVVAGVEVRRQYTARRTDSSFRHTKLTRASLWLVWVVQAIFIILLLLWV